VSASLFWQSFISVDTSYGFLIGAFMLMGLGMGFVMSPMSTAAMNAVEPTKAGVASGILSMSRMVGGTFGVAAMGALVTAIGRHRIEELLPRLPEGARERLTDNLGAGGATEATGAVAAAARDAFVSALGSGLRIGAAVTLAGAVVAWVLIAQGVPAKPQETAAGRPEAVLAEAA
jgi:hypothetical protein